MAKGKRKRVVKPVVEKKPVQEPVVKEKTIYEEFPVTTLNQNDASLLKEIFELSNNVAALIKDYAEKVIIVKQMRLSAKSILDEKQPLMIQVAKNLFKTEKDYKKLSKSIKDQANIVEKQLILVKGQIAHRYEDYVSALIRHNRYIETIVKDAELKSITGHRPDVETQEEEKVLFEKEFDDMTDADIKELKDLNRTISKKKGV